MCLFTNIIPLFYVRVFFALSDTSSSCLNCGRLLYELCEEKWESKESHFLFTVQSKCICKYLSVVVFRMTVVVQNDLELIPA